MTLIPLTLIIFAGFIAALLLFEFIVKWRWFKYFLATVGLVASGIIFFISFYGGGIKQTEIAIALFIASFLEYVVALIISLVSFTKRKSIATQKNKKKKQVATK